MRFSHRLRSEEFSLREDAGIDFRVVRRQSTLPHRKPGAAALGFCGYMSVKDDPGYRRLQP
jgi:hypothetical protein